MTHTKKYQQNGCNFMLLRKLYGEFFMFFNIIDQHGENYGGYYIAVVCGFEIYTCGKRVMRFGALRVCSERN